MTRLLIGFGRATGLTVAAVLLLALAATFPKALTVALFVALFVALAIRLAPERPQGYWIKKESRNA